MIKIRKGSTKIVRMMPKILKEEYELNSFEKEWSNLSNCLEVVYQELHELDEIIGDSLSIV